MLTHHKIIFSSVQVFGHLFFSAGLISAAPYSRLRFYRSARLCSSATVTALSGGRSPFPLFRFLVSLAATKGSGGPLAETKEDPPLPLVGLSCRLYFRHIINILCRLPSPIRAAMVPPSLLIYSLSLVFCLCGRLSALRHQTKTVYLLWHLQAVKNVEIGLYNKFFSSHEKNGT